MDNKKLTNLFNSHDINTVENTSCIPIGKVETDTINRERRKTMIIVVAVEVTTNITHINPQQTNT